MKKPYDAPVPVKRQSSLRLPIRERQAVMDGRAIADAEGDVFKLMGMNTEASTQGQATA